MKQATNYLDKLLKENDKVVVCLSGGPDSMCLLALLIKLRETKKLNIIAAHVNHNVRKASVKEEEFVKKYCDKNNVVFETMKITNYEDDNFHNEARNIRYKFFEEVVKKYQAKYLMTAHHGDDLIETILMRISRGSSLNGYSGFKKEVDRTGYTIIRPLIDNTKEEILAYNKLNKISFVIDKSNNKGKYTRNRYRKNILSFLKKEDKNIHERFLKFSKTIDEYNNYIEKEVEKEFKKVYQNQVLNIKNFNKYDSLIQTKIIEKILEAIYNDDLALINDSHTKEIINLINNKSNKKISLPNNLIVRKNYDEVIFKNEKIVSNYEYELKDNLALPNNNVIKIVKESNETDNYITRLDYSEIELPLKIRNRHDGDKMAIKKLNGTKKIKDIFIDEKIDLEARNGWPLLVDSNDIVLWLPGVKKSKFDKGKNEKYDIIIKYILKEEKDEK